MIGILLVTHGHFAQGIMESARMLVGEQEQLEALCLTETDDVDQFKQTVADAIDRLDDGSGVLVLVDVLGGSPFNTAACQLRQKHIESVTGLNFPMLLAALEGRETEALTELKGTCAQAARDGVVDVRGYMES